MAVLWSLSILNAQLKPEIVAMGKQKQLILSITPEVGYALNFSKTSVSSDNANRLLSYSTLPYQSFFHGVGIDIRNDRFYSSFGVRRIKIGNFLRTHTTLENNWESVPLQLPVYRWVSLLDFQFGFFKTWSNWILQTHGGIFFLPNTYLDQNVGGIQGYSNLNVKDSISFHINGRSVSANNLMPKLGLSIGRILNIQKKHSIVLSLQFQYALGARDIYIWSTTLNTGNDKIILESKNRGTFFASTVNICFPLAKLTSLKN